MTNRAIRKTEWTQRKIEITSLSNSLYALVSKAANLLLHRIVLISTELYNHLALALENKTESKCSNFYVIFLLLERKKVLEN